MDYDRQVPAVERAITLLETLAAAPDGLMAGELAQQMQLSRSTLFALLNTLKAHRYVEQPDERGPYRLGAALFALLPGQSRRLDRMVEAFHADAEIAALSETAVLTILEGSDIIVVAQRESQQTVRVVYPAGERRPADTSAAGLALLAGQPDAPDAPEILRQVRQSGLAQRQTDDLLELACPICADGVRPVAALQIALPVYRQTAVPTLTHTLRQTAARLSYRLGAPVYQPYGWASGDALEPTTPLSRKEIDQFLRQPWGARLACLRPDGTPHVVPLWYEWDGRFLWLAASPGAYWQGYVRENGRVSLTVDEPWPPLRRALVVGEVEAVAETAVPGGLVGLRQRLASHYLGQSASGRAEFQDIAGWQAFRILPEKISGYRGLGRVMNNE
ncbi:MAG: helix-turn-helix domain-containing protein [Ardenticatenaceae bacterium]|nr:helix-turn-helix domain-containing protein [Anaerolineales bacterium]MCB8922126.1 helix-turn-helix domain-containing protein [Ardenticatenaceae bacterium]MCB8991106.1 helix-turn-helix domain-containing protein [Ardenticatenaceae bacterium]